MIEYVEIQTLGDPMVTHIVARDISFPCQHDTIECLFECGYVCRDCGQSMSEEFIASLRWGDQR